MQVHLILPGLLWPQKALGDTAFDLELPALSRLLGRGKITWQPSSPLETRLCREFGIMAEEAPAAALRLLGEGTEPGNGIWLCADPAHLGVEEGRLTLTEHDLDIGSASMRQIAASLAPHFRAHLPAFEEFLVGRHAYLRLGALPRMLTTPPSVVLGRAVIDAQPRGPDARTWQHLGNELQMLLHALPENQEREAQGLPTVNTLWFWGAGALPPRGPSRHDALFGDHPLLAGLAAWAGISYRGPLPDSTSLPSRGATLLLLDDLQAPAQELDAAAWREAIARIERHWLQPLQAAVSKGRIESLRISALGEEACLDISATRSDLLKFWRKSRPLHQLRYPTGFAP